MNATIDAIDATMDAIEVDVTSDALEEADLETEIAAVRDQLERGENFVVHAHDPSSSDESVREARELLRLL